MVQRQNGIHPGFPGLDPNAVGSTRDALHSYARLLGDLLKNCRSKRKHWWHASLRPSLNGLTTGIVQGVVDFEIELDLSGSTLNANSVDGGGFSEKLCGQPATEVATKLQQFLDAHGVAKFVFPADSDRSVVAFPDYSNEQANKMGGALRAIVSVMDRFRAGIREETSPIQVWPHHFDLSMLWLPGDKVSGQDPFNEEYADKQMNFGFTFGDEAIPEPYFYVTAYPEPAGLSKLPLPVGAEWRSNGFSGAVLPYQSLIEQNEPDRFLLRLWNGLLSGGRELMHDATRAEPTK